MDKAEFLNQLRQSLSGRIEADKVTEHLRYYEDYINTQLRLGKTEEEILMSLGSPRLIARSIVDAQQEGSESQENTWEASRKEVQQTREGRLVLPLWARIAIGIAILGFILWLVLSVLAFLAPLLIPLMIVAFLFKFFKDWLK